MEKQFDLITVGRACIDLNAVEYNRPMEETMTFAKYVGGSPVNIAIGTSKLGMKVGFIGKVSNDQHGRFIKKYMADVGINTEHTIFDQEGHTSGMVFTEIKSPEECSILMYRENVADLYLRPEEIQEEYIKKTKKILISGTALSGSPSREAVFQVVKYARKHNIEILFELDYRYPTWKSDAETSVYYSLMAEMSDVVIGTRDEFDKLENKKGENKDTVAYLFQHQPKLIVIKHGVKGSYAYTKDGQVIQGKAYKSNVLKTFGAGDSYASAFLYALNSGRNIETALKFGAAAAAIVVSKHSSSEAMPNVAAIEALIKEQDK
ncbi:5-dehydro-2-deoxygluconokinase [Gilliamella sp. wkB112]|uniref:5-dehydro-2-deoxygluconokinase n=1 Tax=Gilliamella sp. wkB112 TaxID=3120257 RepID=UPI00080EA55B|nr:5-dehydro-2-deoxygluconokinase [Gilliamella apicola]OCG02084.1 5-dehydro-2-deoxygluconokinase [Gilliamella apicola]